MDERVVRDAFHEAVVRYCNLANTAGLRAAGLAPHITVTTVGPLSAWSQDWIYTDGLAHLRGMLSAELKPRFSFAEDPGLPPPGFEFTFLPPPVPRPAPPRDDTPPRRPDAYEPIAVLTLRYDDKNVWPCRVGAASNWLAVGRWGSRAPVRGALMQLPEYAIWVPRGPLLQVRNHHGQFAFRRSSHRPQYEIRVDDTPLPLSGAIEARARGSLVYASGPATTRLTYSVDWEGHHGR
ncbi:hypothetical protein JIG36_41690 [Actinoplanes sp. LDG1-06]|uniref:Uncharacterized protein n=1 Tax=Paractinoplanes ovalisporus TaxID=2810368 RepID=A0ABS2AQF5_9ACTN|nr:hypothetical protein [Actinoplanes ovalisporus]MBM2622036.1 hypothetical protein [Actinoplanes ovalisporus]